jgi:hypothetical protein
MVDLVLRITIKIIAAEVAVEKMPLELLEPLVVVAAVV